METLKLTAPCILVVDDDVLMRALMSNYLTAADPGYEVVLAENGIQALHQLKESRVDLILLDQSMPDMDGLQVCAAIKSQPEYQHIPIVMITADSNMSTLEAAFELGVVDYLRKPFHKTELLARVKNILSLEQRQKEVDTLYRGLQSDLKKARDIQTYFLPQPRIEQQGLCLNSTYIPLQEIGGDFFGIHHQNEYTTLYLGDISGHGIQSALMMTAIKATLDRLIETLSHSPADIVRELQGEISTFVGDCYLTLMCCVINRINHTLTFYNAGHPNGAILDHEGVHWFPSIGGLPVGLFPARPILNQDEVILAFKPGQTLLLYTDGLLDSQKSGVSLNLSIFKEQVLKINQSGQDCHSLMRCLEELGYSDHTDDRTLLGLTYANGLQFEVMVLPQIENVEEQALIFESKMQTLLVDEAEAFLWGMAFRELLNNIFIHGLPIVQNMPIHCWVYQKEDALTLIIEDSATEWQLPKIPDLDAIDTMATSGRGLSMVASMADQMSLKRVGTMNHLELTRKLPHKETQNV